MKTHDRLQKANSLLTPPLSYSSFGMASSRCGLDLAVPRTLPLLSFVCHFPPPPQPPSLLPSSDSIAAARLPCDSALYQLNTTRYVHLIDDCRCTSRACPFIHSLMARLTRLLPLRVTSWILPGGEPDDDIPQHVCLLKKTFRASNGYINNHLHASLFRYFSLPETSYSGHKPQTRTRRRAFSWHHRWTPHGNASQLTTI